MLLQENSGLFAPDVAPHAFTHNGRLRSGNFSLCVFTFFGSDSETQVLEMIHVDVMFNLERFTRLARSLSLFSIHPSGDYQKLEVEATVDLKVQNSR